jgi:hypothetical protein
MALPAIECLRRGLWSLRANWELVAMQWLATLVLVAFLLLGLLPPLVVLGVGSLSALAAELRRWPEWMPAGPFHLAELGAPLLAALVGTLAIWMLAFFVYCYFQAGTYGVLVAADRQAPAHAGRAAGDWRLFRTWSGRDFNGWGGRYLWRFFWFVNLYLAFASVLILLFAVLIVGAVFGGQWWGWPAGVGIGCGGSLPLVFLGMVLGLWMGLAQADLARAASGVRAASRRGLRVLGRRLGGVLLIWLVFLAAAMAVGMLFAPFSVGLDLVLRDAPGVRLGVSLAVTAVQTLVSGALAVFLAASLVALMRGEADEIGGVAA